MSNSPGVDIRQINILKSDVNSCSFDNNDTLRSVDAYAAYRINISRIHVNIGTATGSGASQSTGFAYIYINMTFL